MGKKVGFADDKKATRLSALATIRWTDKMNTSAADHMTNFQLDFSTQRDVVPSKVTGGSSSSTRTMNKGGRPKANPFLDDRLAKRVI
jgi:hypothetical protein